MFFIHTGKSCTNSFSQLSVMCDHNQRFSCIMKTLQKLRERPPYHLSGGEKRKVSLACILSLNPEVLILDEPLAGLDEKTQDMLVDFLQSFHKAGKTLITITHNRQLAETIGTRFACMNEEHELKMLS